MTDAAPQPLADALAPFVREAQPQLPLYEAACRALAEAKTVDEAKDVRDKAEAMRIYARQAKNRQLEIDAAEVRLRAERRLGEMLRDQKETVGLNRGTAGKGRPRKGAAEEEAPNDLPEEQPLTLADAGIDKKLSARAQKLAAVPETKFDQMVCEWRDRVASETERVTVSLMREGSIVQEREAYERRKAEGGTVTDLHALAAAGFKAGAILADPPWSYVTYSGRGQQRSAERYYDTMTLDAIKALPVEALAADDCELFLWGVWPSLPGALDVIAAWGFEYKTLGFLWLKTTNEGVLEGEVVEDSDFRMMLGHYTRANCEPVLIATRGRPKRIDKGVRQLVLAPPGEHSEKPEAVHAGIERLVGGPYLELFGRRAVPGWTVWSNEVKPDIPAPVTEAAGDDEDVPGFLRRSFREAAE